MFALLRRAAGSLAFAGSLLLLCPCGLRADAIEDMLRHERESGRDPGVEKLVSAARAGNAAAQASLGHALLEGHYNGTDRAAGLKWMQKAGENGYAWAFSQLGDFYLRGRGALAQGFVPIRPPLIVH